MLVSQYLCSLFSKLCALVSYICENNYSAFTKASGIFAPKCQLQREKEI